MVWVCLPLSTSPTGCPRWLRPFRGCVLVKKEAGRPVRGGRDLAQRRVPGGPMDPFLHELIPMKFVPVTYLCPLQQHAPPFHASAFSSAERLTTVLASLLPRSIVRLKQEMVSWSVYSRVEGQQCGEVWKTAHRHCELHQGARRRRACVG